MAFGKDPAYGDPLRFGHLFAPLALVPVQFGADVTAEIKLGALWRVLLEDFCRHLLGVFLVG